MCVYTYVYIRTEGYQRSSDVGRAHQLTPLEYELHPTSTSVCITCTFLDSSTTDCVAVVHQRISQLSSSGLMNIESSHKFTRSGDTAYGCIKGVSLIDYQVGVIGGRMVASVTDYEAKGIMIRCGRIEFIILMVQL